jgi:hypothetical protein
MSSRIVKKFALVAVPIQKSCSAYVDDKSGPGGLWEIPGILNICADREPIAGCPVNPDAASLS